MKKASTTKRSSNYEKGYKNHIIVSQRIVSRKKLKSKKRIGSVEEMLKKIRVSEREEIE